MSVALLLRCEMRLGGISRTKCVRVLRECCVATGQAMLTQPTRTQISGFRFCSDYGQDPFSLDNLSISSLSSSLSSGLSSLSSGSTSSSGC